MPRRRAFPTSGWPPPSNPKAEHRRDPLDLFDGSEGLIMGWLSAATIGRASAVSKRWGQIKPEEKEGCLALCVSEDQGNLAVAALRQLYDRSPFRPNVCVAFISDGKGKQKRYMAQLANHLPRDCLVVAAVAAGGVLGTDKDGRNVDYETENAAAVMIMHFKYASLIVLTKDDDFPFDMTNDLRSRLSESCASVGGQEVAVPGLLRELANLEEDPPIHLLLHRASSPLDDIWEYGTYVGGSPRRIYAGTGQLQEATGVILSFCGPGSRAAVIPSAGRGDRYENECQTVLTAAGVLGDGVTPRAAFAVVCNMRGADFHGDDNVEARAHDNLLPMVPLIGFYANGELGPADLVNQSDFRRWGGTTCLGFLGGVSETSSSDAL